MDICELLTLSLFADPYPADKKTCIAVSVLYPVGSTRISRTRPKVFSEKWLLSCVPRCFTMSKKVGHGNKRRATPASPDQLVECMTSQVYYLRILICHKHVSPFIVALLHRCFLPPPPPPPPFVYPSIDSPSFSFAIIVSRRSARDSTILNTRTTCARLRTGARGTSSVRASDGSAITFVRAMAETPRFGHGAAGISDIIINAVAGTNVIRTCNPV